jgi:feruloyl esterase
VAVFALRNPSYDLNSLTLEVFYNILKNGTDVFDQYVGTNNPDLRAFNKAGGKMITYHGLVSAPNRFL